MKITNIILAVFLIFLIIRCKAKESNDGEIEGLEFADGVGESEDGSIPSMELGSDDDFDDDEEEEEDEDEEEYEDNRRVRDSRDIDTFYSLLNDDGASLLIGEESEVLFGMSNKGDEQGYKVFFVMGRIVDSENYYSGFQNLTRLRYNVTIKPGETNTLAYRFTPSPFFEPREIGLILDVLYQGDQDNRTYATTFFNQTLRLVEKHEAIDPRTIFTVGMVVGFFGLVGAFVYFKYMGKNQKRSYGSYRKTQSEEDKKEEEKNIDWDFVSSTTKNKRKNKSKNKKNN